MKASNVSHLSDVKTNVFTEVYKGCKSCTPATALPIPTSIQFIPPQLTSVLWISEVYSSPIVFAPDDLLAWNALPEDSCRAYSVPSFSPSFKCHLVTVGFSETSYLKLQTPFPHSDSLLLFLHYFSP